LPFAGEMVINFVLPYIIYSTFDAKLGDVNALLISSAPPILWSIVQLIGHRRIDALSLLAIGGIVLSILAAIGTGSARALQLREKLVTGLIGLVFVGSALIGKPLIYELAAATMRRKGAAGAAELAHFESFKDSAGFRRTMTIMTLVWGISLIADVAIGIVLVFTLSVRNYLLVGPIVGYAFMGALTLWTFWYSRRAQRRGEARRAAVVLAAAERSSADPQAGTPAG
jgi:hypothetical protein